MKQTHNRRNFLKAMAATGIGLGLSGNLPAAGKADAGKRVGIIGLDTSHSIAFTKVLNAQDAGPQFGNYKVVAAYPYGSKDIESSTKRIPDYIEEIKTYKVEIVGSIKELLDKVDVVLLETNDGRLHLEQALQVFKAGKRMFIDKPVAGSLADAVAIYDASKKYNIPVFSASSLRYIKGVEGLDKSKVLGADTFSPATIEKTHPDLFWYGVHGVETLFTVMGRGCKSVVRVHTEGTDVVIGTWEDGRVGTFRGTRTGKHEYGGTVYGENGNIVLGPYAGYEPLLENIITYFQTGQVPVSPEETLEIFAFMEAADESKRKNGASVTLASVLEKAKNNKRK
ncbi:Gfo/Idh/MocA family oxidoreductase [Rhodocytophaga aerolata]|uniref:Gfo/Idh/MocA family oxidoreductase n=1 Tax=Rhodocytophaga aerolata TaxID=455078 RepID=A0ABT8RFK7_9BACT|nr:Gfo/Idh/MocA family oxidoreductase [Rhodocytophaga aerolata]MDO1450890.1 Gfo/Idh/MocA family oxidoreductase [Rhodocytophaga aerolata]